MKKINLLLIGMFALGLDAYVIAGLIPAMTATYHVSAATMGQTVTVFTLFYALSAPIFSTLLAGRPIRHILLFAMVLFIVANVASALAGNFTCLLIARAFAGMGAGLFSPMAAMAAVSLVPPQYKGRALALILGGMSAGTVIGVPIGLLITQYSTWQNTFWFVCLLGCIAMIGIYWLFPPITAKQPPTLKERIVTLTDPRVTCSIMITLLTSIASLGLYTYLALLLRSSIGEIAVSPYIWVWGIGGIAGSFTIGSLIDATGKPRHLMAGILFLMSVSMFLIPVLLPFSILGLMPLFLWGAMGWSSQAPQQHTLLLIQPEFGAAAVALNSSANYLGSAIGAAVGGIVMACGVSATYLPWGAGLIAFLAFVGQLLIIKRESPNLLKKPNMPLIGG